MNERYNDPQPLAKLKRFLSPQASRRADEHCEFCSTAIGAGHSHVVAVETRSLMCVCRPCYLLFTPSGAAHGKYKAVPQRCISLPGCFLSDAQWDSLQIPVGIAFFFFNSALGRMAAFYPGPAGATESQLALETWEEVVKTTPVLETLVADVEALLIYNVQRRQRFDCLIVPIDACYELVGRMRRLWKGFDGGDEAWQEIDDFFAGLRERSTTPDSTTDSIT